MITNGTKLLINLRTSILILDSLTITILANLEISLQLVKSDLVCRVTLASPTLTTDTSGTMGNMFYPK